MKEGIRVAWFIVRKRRRKAFHTHFFHVFFLFNSFANVFFRPTYVHQRVKSTWGALRQGAHHLYSLVFLNSAVAVKVLL